MKRIVTFLLVLVMVAGMIPATVWAAEAYTITFDPNGGTCATETVTVNEGEAIGTLPVPVREDRIFKGWYLDVENGTRITEEDVFTESTTLYAKWDYAAWKGWDFFSYLGNKASGIGLVNNGSKVELGERCSQAARWRFVGMELCTYKIVSVVDGTVLDVTEDGTGICTAPDTDAPTQRWMLKEATNEYPRGYSLVSASTGKVVTVVSEGTEFAEGDGVQLAWEDGSDGQILYMGDAHIHDESVLLIEELYVGEEEQVSIPVTGVIDDSWYFTLTVDEEYIEVIGTEKNSAWELQYFTLMPKKAGVIEGVYKLYDGISSNLMNSQTVEFRIFEKDNTSKITYYHDNQVMASVKVTNGVPTTVSKGLNPTKDGYVFVGWNTDMDGLGDTYKPGDSITIYEDTALYAEWRLYNPASVTGVTRIAGADRYKTAFLAADQLKERMGVKKFSTVIVASGTDFADALSGSYLASVKNAPILLVRNSNATIKQVKNYIKENVAPGGIVYLLGGEKAVPKSMETGLDRYTVRRLGGATRYDTNLQILKEAGIGRKDILICTGEGFADSLSASAVERPILLVKNKLSASQKDFLEGTTGKKYIVGGTGAVSTRIENEVKNICGNVERLGGTTRYETSILVAETFFDYADQAVVAYAQNFPDGLSGGALACRMKAPLILTANGKDKTAAAYFAQEGIEKGYVLGGTGLISDKTVRNIFNMEEKDPINLIK